MKRWSFWDTYARIYDELALTAPYRHLHEDVECLLDAMPHERILDVGCGTGLFLERLARETIPPKLVGIDASPAMLARATQRVGDHAMLMHHDAATTLPFDAESFDAVVCMQVLYTLPDPDAALREIRRVLKANGRLALVNPHNADRRAIMRAHYASVWSGDRLPLLLQETRIATAFAALYVLNGYIVRRAGDRRFHFLSPDVLAQKVMDAGFVIRERHASVYGGTSVFLLAQCR